MFVDVLILAIGLWFAAEIFEHIVFPLIRKARGRRPLARTGPEAMIGRTGVVKRWAGDRGQVAVGNEIWAAESDTPLAPGDRVVVEDIRGLTLRVRGES